MKNLMKCFALAMTLMLVIPVQAQKKAKTIDWKDGKMPQLTQVQDINKYLLTCDSLIQGLKNVDEMVTFYSVQKKEQANGSVKYLIVDEEGNLRGKNEALKQTLEVIAMCTQLTMQGTRVGMMSTSYAAGLKQLDLKQMLSYGKYATMGGKLAARCGKEVVDILTKLRKQGKAIRQLKKMTNDKYEAKDPNLNMAEALGLETIEESPKASDELLKELATVAAKDKKIDVSDADFDLD